MKIPTIPFFSTKSFLWLIVPGIAAIATSASATLVTWSLNPNNQEGLVGATSYTFVSSGSSITAYGYTVGSTNTPLGLYFKNQGADETGLGIAGPSDHELQGSGSYPVQFIQFSLSSILAQGFTNGQIEMGSVQSASNDTFMLYGSNTQGTLGTAISGVYNSSSDQKFVDIAAWGTYQYISVGAISGDSLPIALQATLTPVPEVGAFFPILGILVAVGSTGLLRRRQRARADTASSLGNS